MNLKHALFLAIAMLFVQNKSLAQTQKLEFHIPQIADSTTIYLARYYGDKLYYADTAKVKNGTVIFDGSKHTTGLFAVVLPGSRFFQFINEKEAVEMTMADTSDMGGATVQQSQNNLALYAYFGYMRDQSKKMNTLNQKYEAAKGNPKKEAAIAKKVKVLNKKANAFRAEIVAANQGLFVEQLIRMTMDVELPDYPRDKNGVITDSNYVYNYFVRHYWDGIDLKNPGLVYSPIFHSKLDTYFSEKVLLQIPDTVIKYAMLLVNQMDQQNEENEVFKYSLSHIMTKYNSMQIMGMDKVFWSLGETYYCGPFNKAHWVSADNLKRVCDQVKRLSNVIIGHKAVPLILTDTTEQNWINFYDIEADYTVLYFWEPDCGHCKVHTPELQVLYEKKFKDRNIEVFAVAGATGDNFEAWKKFIREKNLTFINVGITKNVFDQAMKDPRPLLKYTTLESLNYSSTYDVSTTPRIFILDKDKTILYKQLSISQLETILDDLTGHKDDEKLFPMSNSAH